MELEFHLIIMYIFPNQQVIVTKLYRIIKIIYMKSKVWVLSKCCIHDTQMGYEHVNVAVVQSVPIINYIINYLQFNYKLLFRHPC